MAKQMIKEFSKYSDTFVLPSLLDLQVKSYDSFLQRESEPDKRAEQGLEEVFREVFPLESYDGQIKLVFDAIRQLMEPPPAPRASASPPIPRKSSPQSAPSAERSK